MTRKSRYFLIGSAGILLLGIGGGLVAYYSLHRAPGVPEGLPAELRFVPADAVLVAYADVHSVMASDMRRELERIAMGQRHGQQQAREFVGIDIEKNINHVVAYMQAEGGDAAPPRALVLAQGTFDQAHVEQFVRDHGGSVEDYHGKHLLVRKFDPAPAVPPAPPGNQPALPAPPQAPNRPDDDMAIGFVQSDLLAMGGADLVRRALDAPPVGNNVANVTSNADLMKLIRDASSGNAWVVGRFDAVSRRIGLPANLRQQVPPLRLVSASARIDSGVKATLKVETADKAAADQLRDVVRGAISFARLQAGSKPELQDAFKSIELGGSGTTVQLSFQMTTEAFRAITPQRLQPQPESPKQ